MKSVSPPPPPLKYIKAQKEHICTFASPKTTDARGYSKEVSLVILTKHTAMLFLHRVWPLYFTQKSSLLPPVYQLNETKTM